MLSNNGGVIIFKRPVRRSNRGMEVCTNGRAIIII